jgi:thiol-disulfide isomerase/thioredoxin
MRRGRRPARGSAKPALVVALALLLGAPGRAEELDLRTAELHLKTLAGRPTKLGPYVGKLTLVNLWATWCPPCRDEMPALEQLRKRYRARGFEVVGLSVDHTVKPVLDFLKQHPVGYPVVIGTEETVPALGQLESLPTSILLDAHGAVLEVMVGPIDMQAVTADIEQRLPTKPR